MPLGELNMCSLFAKVSLNEISVFITSVCQSLILTHPFYVRTIYKRFLAPQCPQCLTLRRGQWCHRAHCPPPRPRPGWSLRCRGSGAWGARWPASLWRTRADGTGLETRYTERCPDVAAWRVYTGPSKKTPPLKCKSWYQDLSLIKSRHVLLYL